MPEPSVQYLLHACIVVLSVCRTYFETSVFLLRGLPVFKYDHRSYDLGGSRVGYIICLKPVRRLLKPEKTGHSLQAFLYLAAASQSFIEMIEFDPGVLRYHFHHMQLFTALRYPDTDLPAAFFAEPLLDDANIVEFSCHNDLGRYYRCTAIKLFQE